MNILQRFLSSLFAPAPPAGDANAIICYVRGRRCGAITRVRINRMNDLSRDEDGESFIVRKGIVDEVCFDRVEVTLRFNSNYAELSREIQGGEFVTAAEYEAWLAQRAAEPTR